MRNVGQQSAERHDELDPELAGEADDEPRERPPAQVRLDAEEQDGVPSETLPTAKGPPQPALPAATGRSTSHHGRCVRSCVSPIAIWTPSSARTASAEPKSRGERSRRAAR